MDYNQQYYNTKQQKGQSVTQFVNYLKEIKDNIPYLNL